MNKLLIEIQHRFAVSINWLFFVGDVTYCLPKFIRMLLVGEEHVIRVWVFSPYVGQGSRGLFFIVSQKSFSHTFFYRVTISNFNHWNGVVVGHTQS